MNTSIFDFLMLQDTSIVVLGCSYGPDSMALFNLLLEKRREIPFQIVIAHVNHNKRKKKSEAARKRKF